MSDKKILRKIGFILLGLSVVTSLSIFILPFFMPTTATKFGAIGVLAVLTEVFFWVGGILVGREIITKIKTLFNLKNWVNNEEVEIKEVNELDELEEVNEEVNLKKDSANK